ncbi:RsmB/NOP family class I SAM-dependent RNA methyltransferase [Raoultibacter phocaeensis]|uniref:RsmB/NOP family class I SAM-dependent RNA methyltransferase n=1 Tax=Raoultibacter phocaeensis TaxID=2479841 RepID=UPI00111ABFDA|nr:transcription antitermination factor NusB [Raoultibacter phocaeensis]
MAYKGSTRISKASPARKAALEVGATVRARSAFTQDIISKTIDRSPLTPEDRAFATRLALGVTSSVGTLDEVIDRCLKSPSDIKCDVRDALRVSAYEILFLEKSPHAAVDQGVELVRSVAPKAAGLANAVLRKIVAAKAEFPFGDPETDTAALARQHAFPVWLAERLIADLGRDAACAFMQASNEPAPVFVAVNSLKATDDEVLEIFEREGAPLSPVSFGESAVPGCFRLASPRTLAGKAAERLFAAGKILVSDAASQAIAFGLLADRGAPATFLEIGAGRATKTILLQSNSNRLFESQIALSTLDNHEFKTKLLEERAKRYGARVDRAYTGDATDLASVVGAERFDTVFIDAPCSGLGTLRRHPEIRWRITPQDVASLANTGFDMLVSAAAHVNPGGSLVFATCTVLREENEAVVRRFLESEAGAAFDLDSLLGKRVFSVRLAPRSSDAHFAVRLVRAR